jgi:hypothetical protein
VIDASKNSPNSMPTPLIWYRLMIIASIINTIGIVIVCTLSYIFLKRKAASTAPMFKLYNKTHLHIWATGILVMQLQCFLSIWLLNSDWAFVAYFLLFSTMAEILSLQTALVSWEVVLESRLQERINGTILEPMRLFNSMALDVGDEQGAMTRKKVVGTGRRIFRNGALLIVCIQLILPIIITAIISPQVLLHPLINLLVLNIPAITITGSTAALYLFLFGFMKGMSDSYKIRTVIIRTMSGKMSYRYFHSS